MEDKFAIGNLDGNKTVCNIDRDMVFGKGNLRTSSFIAGICFLVLFALLLFVKGNAHSAQITLAWDAEAGAAGYKIYFGTTSDAYVTAVDVGDVTTYPLTLADGHTYYLAATAYDSANLESDFSAEIRYPAGVNEGTPRISISPSSINIGTVRKGASAFKTVTIKNTGTGTLDLGALAVTGTNAGEFSTSTNCSSLLRHESCNITVSLTGVSFGSKTATLTIPSNDPKKPTSMVKIKGTCAPPRISASPATVNFGTVPTNTASPVKHVTIKNTGTSDLIISSISKSGDTSFAVSDNPCGTLAKGSSCAVSLTFTPSTAGSIAGSLIISSNDPSKGTVTVKLIGRGK
jgi:hypothetical protein